MNLHYIRSNTLEVSILCFLLLYISIHVIQPGMIYDHHGCLRQFGINQTQKTILPAWLVAIIVAILSYLGILFVLAYTRIMNKYRLF